MSPRIEPVAKYAYLFDTLIAHDQQIQGEIFHGMSLTKSSSSKIIITKGGFVRSRVMDGFWWGGLLLNVMVVWGSLKCFACDTVQRSYSSQMREEQRFVYCEYTH